MTAITPTALTLIPFEPADFSPSVSLLPLVLNSADPLTLDVGLTAGSNNARGIVNPNINLNSHAVIHHNVTAETANGAARAAVAGQIWASGYSPTKANDNIGLLGLARTDVTGIQGPSPGGLFADALGCEAFGTIGGGATYAAAWGALFSATIVTDVSLSLQTLDPSTAVQTLTSVTGITPGMWIGDKNNDSIVEGTTVLSVNSGANQVTLSAPPLKATAANSKLLFSKSQGMLTAIEASVNHNGPTYDSNVVPATDGSYPSWVYKAGSLGASPATGVMMTGPFNVTDSKAAFYHGLWFTNCTLDYVKVGLPGRPGAVGFYMTVDNTDQAGCVKNATTAITRTGGSAFAAIYSVGQRVSGVGIPPGTKIAAISSDLKTITLTKAATDSLTSTLHFSDWGSGTRIPYNVPHVGFGSDAADHELIQYDNVSGAVAVGDVATPLLLRRSDAPDYTITNPTTLRTLDVSGGTLTDVKQAVGTLIADLIALGVLK